MSQQDAVAEAATKKPKTRFSFAQPPYYLKGTTAQRVSAQNCLGIIMASRRSFHRGGDRRVGTCESSSKDDDGGGSDLMASSSSDSKRLIELQEELIKVTSDATALETTRWLAGAAVDNFPFLLLFLRDVDDFSVQSAADRIVRHLQTKITLFGSTKLRTSIALQDLSLNCQMALSSGGLQFLSSKDAQGRAVLVTRYSRMKYHDPASMVSNKKYGFMRSRPRESRRADLPQSLLSIHAIHFSSSSRPKPFGFF